MDEEKRKAELEQKYNIELHNVPDTNLYQLRINDVQRVFIGLPIVFKLDQIEILIPRLDELTPDWRD